MVGKRLAVHAILQPHRSLDATSVGRASRATGFRCSVGSGIVGAEFGERQGAKEWFGCRQCSDDRRFLAGQLGQMHRAIGCQAMPSMVIVGKPIVVKLDTVNEHVDKSTPVSSVPVSVAIA